MSSRPAMLGLVFFCVGSVICLGGGMLISGRYPQRIVMALGIAFLILGLWLAFVGYRIP